MLFSDRSAKKSNKMSGDKKRQDILTLLEFDFARLFKSYGENVAELKQKILESSNHLE